MPTYEYTCRACGHTFDIVQPMSDETLTICPECGGVLRKVFGAPAISFKGSGFYATDHGKKKSKQTSERSGDKTAASAESSSDSSSTREKGDASRKGDKGGATDGGSTKESAKPAEKAPSSSGAGSGGKAAS